MKYFVVSDPHSYFTIMHNALIEKGFDENNPEHKLIICGDLMDRGNKSLEMQEYVLSLLAKDKVILIRGNHEDLMLDLIKDIRNYDISDLLYSHHARNGTLRTAFSLTNKDLEDAMNDAESVSKAIASTPFVKTIIPQMLNYYETEHYVFVHGWVPYEYKDGKYCVKDLKTATEFEWRKARWENGIAAAVELGATIHNKTIVCGHWHTDYGHSRFGKASKNIKDKYLPFYSDGIIALDASTAVSLQINCIVVED